MPYITIKEYAELALPKKVTRQAIEDRIKRKTLNASHKPIKTIKRCIYIPQELWEKIKPEVLARRQGEE